MPRFFFPLLKITLFILFKVANFIAAGIFKSEILVSCSSITSASLILTFPRCSLISGFLKFNLEISISIDEELSIVLVIHFKETHSPENLERCHPKIPYSNKS